MQNKDAYLKDEKQRHKSRVSRFWVSCPTNKTSPRVLRNNFNLRKYKKHVDYIINNKVETSVNHI